MSFQSSTSRLVAAVSFAILHSAILHLTMADEKYNQRVSDALTRATKLVEKSATEYLKQRECFSCHHQAMPIIALSYAQRRGVRINESVLKEQIEHSLAHFKKNTQRYLDGKGTGGQVDTAGYGMWALKSGKIEKSPFTDAVVHYLLKRDRNRNHWRRSSERPPSEASNLTATFVAIKALRNYGSVDNSEIKSRILKVQAWAEQQKEKDTEDLVFKLRIMQELGLRDQTRSLGAELQKQQRENGGWSQNGKLKSDPYATATSLVALVESGTIKSGDSVHKKGIDYLLDSQKLDGSWHVKSRSSPFQEYFESGFPHKEDQFISITATCWAIMALSQTRELK